MSRGQIILMDNNAISACHDLGGWKALASGFQLETVEEVASEAGTGYQHREIIDPAEFREVVAVHAVSRHDRLACQSRYADLGMLDDGERDLWVHATGRSDAWMLCGPDIASIRFGVRAGYTGRLVSLEELLMKIGYPIKGGLREHFTRKWLQARIDEFSLELAFERARTEATPAPAGKRGGAAKSRR